ncbi:MAG: acetylornithine/succinylornithine family transaminase [bacterium]
MQNILAVYRKIPLSVKKAEGKFIWDTKGKKYLDFFSGISVTSIGHRNGKVLKAIEGQISKYLHVSNYYTDAAQEKYAAMLVKRSFQGKVFFSNSGGEANELAIKLVRSFGADRKRYRIISFKNSFHGRSMSTLSATGQKKFQKGFAPLLSGFDFAVFNDIDSVRKLIGKSTVAVIIEPVQGEGGVYPAEKSFLKELRELCTRKNLLLILDEIQTGFGRCGSAFAFQSYGIKPDILTLAKAAGGGLPLGVTVLRAGLEKYLPAGSHGSTFGGNPVSCAAGLATLGQIDGKMLKRVNRLGAFFTAALEKLKKESRVIKEVRGRGLMLGVELKKSIASDIARKLLKRGILVNDCKPDIVRFLPPFTVSEKDILFVVGNISESLKKI